MNELQILVTELIAPNVANLNPTPTQVEQVMEEVEQEILNYCNIETVPKELRFTWSNMAVDLLKYRLAVITPVDTTEQTSGQVSKITVGDTSYELTGGIAIKDRNKVLATHQANLDNVLMNYKAQLNKFRRMVW